MTRQAATSCHQASQHWMGAHQPDQRLPLAQQHQGRRGQVQAVATATTGLTCFIFRFLRRPPSRLVSGLCGGIGGVAPDGDGCFAAIKPAPGMNAGYVLRKPLTAFASWKTGFCCARCCAVGVVGQGAGVLGGLSAPSGGLTRGRGSRREAVGEPRRGSPAFRPLAAVSFPQRLSQGDVKEFIKLKTARARYGV